MSRIEGGEFHIERQQSPELAGQGRLAEEVVIDFFRRHFPNMEMRKATPNEDAGSSGFGPKKTVDAIGYLDKKPAIALQITSSTGEKFRAYREKKLNELKEHPFLRLEEMGPQDSAIPKALVFVEPKELKQFSEDHDFSKHSALSKSILDSTLNSLKFDLMQTKNPKEIRQLNSLISMLEIQKKKS